MKWIGQHIYDLAARFRGDVTIEGDLTVNGTYTQIDTDVTTTEQWLVTNDGTGPAAIINQKGSQDIFDVQDDGTSVFYIEDGGNVGIGTTTPSQKLEVNGNIALTGNEQWIGNSANNSANKIKFFGSSDTMDLITGDTSAYNGWDFLSGTTSRVRITRLGNVGIGTSSPTQALHLPDSKQIALGTGADLKIQHNGTNSEIGNSTGQLNIYNHADNSDINFMADDGSGGIETYFFLDGSASQVVSNVTLKSLPPDANTHSLILGRADTGNVWNVNHAGADFRLYNLADSGSNILLGVNSGSGVEANSVGIGVATPASLLHVAGTVQVGEDDTGHDVKFYGATSGRYLLWDESADALKFTDSTQLILGTGNDLIIQHASSNSYINSFVGDFYIKQQADDKDIIFQSDDGSGGVETYFFLDGSTGVTTFPDDKRLTFGTDRDLFLYHTGGTMVMKNYVGDMTFTNNANDKDIIFQSDDGSGGVATYFYLDGSIVENRFAKATRHSDNIIAKFGDGNDLNIYSDGTNGIISTETDDGDLILKCDDGSGGTTAYLTLDGSVGYIYVYKDLKIQDSVYASFGTSNDFLIGHDGTNTRLYNYTGNMQFINYADDSDIIFQSDDGAGGLATYFSLDGSAATHDGSATTALYTLFPDKSVLGLGSRAEGDMRLYHNGSNSYIYNYTGNLEINNHTDDGDIIFQCDDGSGGLTAYLTLDGSAGYTTAQKNIQFIDNAQAYFGTGVDLRIYHDGSNSYIKQAGTGDLYIQQTVDDKDIIFQSDDGSGGVTPYLTLDGSRADGTYTYTTLPDSGVMAFGASVDMQLYHNATDSIIRNNTGDLKIINYADDKDIIFQSDNGAGATATYFSLDGSLAAHDGSATTGLFTKWGDNSKIAVGNGADGRFYHNATNTYLENTNGDLYIQNKADDKDIIFQSDDGSGGLAEYFRLNGGLASPYTVFPDDSRLAIGGGLDLRFHHDGGSSYIGNYTGNLLIRNFQDDGDISFQCDDGSGGVETYFYLDGSQATGGGTLFTKWGDSSYISLGDGSDLYFFHNGTDSKMQNSTGDLVFENYADDKDIIFKSDDGSGGTTPYLTLDGSEGHLTVQKEMNFGDNVEATFGASNDLKVYHSGSHSYMIQRGTGNLYIQQTTNDADIIFACDNGAGGNATYFSLDGSSATHDGSATTALITRFPDNSKIYLGTGDDGRLYHNGTDTYLQNTTGDLIIQNFADDKDIILKSDDGSGGTTAYLTLDGSTKRVEVDVQMGINAPAAYTANASADELVVGSGSGTQGMTIYGATGTIYFATDLDEEGAGDDPAGNRHGILKYTPSEFTFKTGGNQSAAVIGNGGSSFTSTLTVGVDDTGHDVKFYGATSGKYLLWDESQDRLEFTDSTHAAFGTDGDMLIYHDGTDGYVTEKAGDLYIRNQADDKDIIFQSDDGAGGVTAYLTLDGREEEVVFSKPIVTAETQIKVLPHQFMSNEDGGVNKSSQFRDDTIIGVRSTADDSELYAFVEIPYGKTATSVTVYGNDTSLVVNVYESDINAGALTDKTPGGGCVVGTACDITDVAYSATNYLVIKVTTVSYTNDIVYGAVVTIT